MIGLHKYAFRLGNRIAERHATFYSEPQKRRRHPEFSRPCRETLQATFMLQHTMPCSSDTISLFSRCGKCSITPSVTNSVIKRISMQSKSLRPLSHTESFTIECHKDIAFDIPLLHFDVCPSAIAGLVSTGAVNSVNGCAIWPDSHVIQEIIEVQPSLTYSNTECPITAIAAAVRFGTATHHVIPCIVSCRTTATSMPVLNSGIFGTSNRAEFCYLRRSRIFARTKNRSTFRASFFHARSLAHNKAKVAGVMVSLPGLTKRRAREMEVCLKG